MENYASDKYNIKIIRKREYWVKQVLDKWIKYEATCFSCIRYILKLKSQINSESLYITKQLLKMKKNS